MYRFLAWLLRSWADYVLVERNHELEKENDRLRSRLSIEEGEVERLTLNHRKWCATVRAETDAQLARSALAAAVGEGSSIRGE